MNQAEAAVAVGVSLSTFKRHFAPHIDCAYIGGARLYLVEDLAAFVRSHRDRSET